MTKCKSNERLVEGYCIPKSIKLPSKNTLNKWKKETPEFDYGEWIYGQLNSSNRPFDSWLDYQENVINKYAVISKNTGMVNSPYFNTKKQAENYIKQNPEKIFPKKWFKVKKIVD